MYKKAVLDSTQCDPLDAVLDGTILRRGETLKERYDHHLEIDTESWSARVRFLKGVLNPIPTRPVARRRHPSTEDDWQLGQKVDAPLLFGLLELRLRVCTVSPSLASKYHTIAVKLHPISIFTLIFACE